MTDAEKELRRLAQKEISLNGGLYGHSGAAKLGEAVLALLERIEALEDFALHFATTAEAALSAHDAPKGGMQAPYTDDFAHLPPSIARNLRWWAREARRALGEKDAPPESVCNCGNPECGGCHPP